MNDKASDFKSVEVATEWEVEWKIHLPQAKPVLMTINKGANFPRSSKNTPNVGQNSSVSDDVDHPRFDENDRWPRRLLDVTTMTSHQWQPGNSYGGVKEPSYSVLSYTWGRWRIEDEHSTVKAVRIDGVPWEIPKTEETHFTAEQFENILQLIVKTSNKGFLQYRRCSNFVWLDIACIPQFRNSAIADSEVGRQARIFRGADIGYIWLTTQSSTDLEKLVNEHYSDPSDDVSSLFNSFCKILGDPWFKSTWTLQESFIQNSALIISNTGICFEDSHRLKPLRLNHIRNLADNLLEHKQINGFTQEAEPHFAKFEAMWASTGLQGPRKNSPMQVLACSQYRTCEDPPDRVYGIMQIFGDEFRVGKARATTEAERVAARSMTPPELEDELGGLVMKHFPVGSQIFRHDEPPLAGRAWRICGEASIPQQLAHPSPQFEVLITQKAPGLFTRSDCTLSFTPSQHSLQLAAFEGSLCRLDKVIECSKSEYFAPALGYFDIHMDAGPDFANFGGSDKEIFLRYFDREALMVLSLSRIKGTIETSTQSYFTGLLLMGPGPAAQACHRSRRQWHSGLDSIGLQTWARVGICQMKWAEPDSGPFDLDRPEIRTLWGISDDWKVQKGYWG